MLGPREAVHLAIAGLDLRAPFVPWQRLRALSHHLPILALITAVALLNLPSLSGYFHGDDFVAFVDLTSREPLDHLWRVFTFSDSNFYWRPLGEVYHLALYLVFGLDAFVFRLANLLVFLATIYLLYVLCLRLGLPRPVALGACLIFGVFPNHTVSVFWVTNGQRLLSMLFFVACLVSVEKASRTGRKSDEALAWLFFVAAGLSDETTLALAPIPLLLSFVVRERREGWLPGASRVLGYAGLVAALLPLQFALTRDDEPRLAAYGFGEHALSQIWALSSHLVAPVDGGGTLAKSFVSLAPEHWVAGALAVAAGVLLLLLGSPLTRLLAVWCALGLAPFALWDMPWLAPRYVYLAAIPFSMLVAWAAYAAWQARPRIAWREIMPLVVLPLAAYLLFWSAQATLERNRQWDNETEQYRALAEGIKTALPDLRHNTRLIIYYGVWRGWSVWPEAVVRSVYRDDTLDVVSIGKEASEGEGPPPLWRDVVVYYADGKFIPVPPKREAAGPR